MAHKRKLRNFLLNRSYQLRFMLIMVVLTSALTAGLGHFWYKEMRTTSRMLEVKAMADMMSDKEVKKIQQTLDRKDRNRLFLLIGFGVVLALLISGYSLISTHKVAGPLYKISRHMSDISQNRHYEIWGLRKGDQLKDFFEDFKSMADALRDRVSHEAAIIDAAVSKLEASAGADDVLVPLKALAAEKRASLERASDQTMQRVEHGMSREEIEAAIRDPGKKKADDDKNDKSGDAGDAKA